jgi:transcriptional regulator with PAS, ATPase and Fis domain
MAGDTISVRLEKRSKQARLQAFLSVLLRADQPLSPGLRAGLEGLDEVRIGRGERLGAEVPGRSLQLSLPDPGVSGNHAKLIRKGDGWTAADTGSKNGTLINGQALTAPRLLRDGDLIETGHTFLLFRTGVVTPAETAALVRPEEIAGLSTLSPPFAEELRQLRAIAVSRVPVVLGGETGSGKEVLASLIHSLSRRPGAFQAVNCGALSPTLLESELFGYRKGAFSGADEDRPGLVRSADRGTLFLDEFADLPLPAQASLLRVLQESEVVPVGGTRPVRVDLRVVVASHRDLEELVRREALRADLLARVSGFTLKLPALRERREDLGLLVAALLRRADAAKAPEVSFSPDAARALLLYSWPRNIRELERTLGAALALCEGRIELRHLSPALREAPAAEEPRPALPLSDEDQALRARLLELLREHRGNVSAVAQAMDKFRNQVQRWLKRFELDPADYRD